MVISKGIFHPTVFCRKLFKKTLLAAKGGNAFEFSPNINKLDGLDANQHYAVVLFFHEKTISNSQLNSLISYVNNGGRLFCIHGALASFKSSEGYIALIGAKFTGHDEIKDMNIEGDVAFKIKDELYKFEISGDCNVRLQCSGVPVYWTRRQGNGKIACLSPGHRTETFRNKEFVNLISLIMADELGLNGGSHEKS